MQFCLHCYITKFVQYGTPLCTLFQNIDTTPISKQTNENKQYVNPSK